LTESLSLTFSHYFQSILIAADDGEKRVAQAIIGGPLQKLDSDDNEWLQPPIENHFRGCQAFAPSPFYEIGQIDEWAAR
jgi:hypothetical protein